MEKNALAALLRDPRLVQSMLQGMNNAAASNVTGPVDGLAWLLRKTGMPIPDEPLMGSKWMERNGLMAEPSNKLGGLLGEGVGLAIPVMGAAKAAQMLKGKP